MKWLISGIFASLFPLLVQPMLHATSDFDRFRAYPYAVQGYQLAHLKDWRAARAAFYAAHRRDPGNIAYIKAVAALELAEPSGSPRLSSQPQWTDAVVASTVVQPLPTESTPVRFASPHILLPVNGITLDDQIMRESRRATRTSLADAYAAVQRGDLKAAREAFAQYPGNPEAIAQIAYIDLQENHRHAAMAGLASAAALTTDTAARARWQADQKPLTRVLRAAAQVFWRDGAIDPRLAQSQTILGTSGSYGQVDVRLNGNPDRPIYFLSSAAAALNSRSFATDPRSVQVGVGFGIQPIVGSNAYIDAIRLIAAGPQARNDWEVRTGVGFGRGYGPSPGNDIWLHWQARTDTALIGFRRGDVFTTADARLGLGYSPAERWALTPYAGSTFTLQRAGTLATLYEASPGLWLHHSLDRAGQHAIDLKVDYRRKLVGTAAATNGVAVTIAGQF